MFLRWKWIEETSCHALLCFEGVVTWNFVCTRKRETICSLFSNQWPETPVSCEDRCFLKGLFWAPKLATLNSSSREPLLHPATAPVGMWTPDWDRGASAAPSRRAEPDRWSETVAEADGGAVRESRAGANSSTCWYPVVAHYSKDFMRIVPGSE